MTTSADQHSAALPAVIAALLDPASYSHPVAHVQLIQTHISYVLLAGEYVYKVRKPVDFGFLDFSTLRKRLHDCRREINLNRRLCAWLYVDVIPITFDGQRYTPGGRGRVVEYAVQMHRLPQERMMDALLAEGKLTREMVEALAERIAAFHANSMRGRAIDRHGSARAIRRNWDENVAQTTPFIGRTIAFEQQRMLQEWTRAFIRRERELLQRRVATGRIRDCHGDLRTSAVCFVDGICVFDCIAFNQRFRYGDVAADVAFLAMDLELHGRADLADAFVQRYVATSGDEGLRRLLPFYACYRAYVRGKVESFRLDEPEVPLPDKRVAADVARSSFALACRYAAACPLPLLLMVGGLSGTGKTTLAALLATRLSAQVVSSDVVRKELAGLSPTMRRAGAYGHDIYSAHFTARTYAEMRRQAGTHLAAGRSVILDATFASRQQRDQARQVAQRAGALFWCVECVASERSVRVRLERRDDNPGVVSDARWDTYVTQRAAFEQIEEFDDWQHIVVEMDQPLDACLTAAHTALAQRLCRDTGSQ